MLRYVTKIADRCSVGADWNYHYFVDIAWWCRYEILTVVNVPQSDNDDVTVIDASLTGVINSDARIILLYATQSVFRLFFHFTTQKTGWI